jgi:integrase
MSREVDVIGARAAFVPDRASWRGRLHGPRPRVLRRAGETIHPQRLTEWFRRHRKAADIPTGSLHVLRHTSATLALTSGVPVHIVAAMLGDTPTTVLNTYAHLLPQSDEVAAERVAALIG